MLVLGGSGLPSALHLSQTLAVLLAYTLLCSTMSSAISFGDANCGIQAGIVHGSVNTTFQLQPGTSVGGSQASTKH